MGWKTPKFEVVNGYKIVEVDGPTFKVYDGTLQLGGDFPYSGEAAAYCKCPPKRRRGTAGQSPTSILNPRQSRLPPSEM